MKRRRQFLFASIDCHHYTDVIFPSEPLRCVCCCGLPLTGNSSCRNHLLMTPYWIRTDAVRLAIIPRPRGDDWLPDDISILQRAGVDVIVSALTPSEEEELGLAGEAECCRNSGMRFLSFPVEDRSVPASESDFKGLVELIDEFLSKGNAVAVHCRAGIGRSSIITASVLIHRGLPVERAFSVIEEARGCPVPDTQEQRAWVEHLSSRLKPCRE